METSPLVSINLVVFNGEKYIRHCLRGIKEQIYPNLEVTIFDNNSADSTKKIIREEFPEYNLIESSHNYGMWPGQEKTLEHSHGEYIVAISVDIILDNNFVTNAVKVFEKDGNIGAIEAKIYQYSLKDINEGQPLTKKIIDTCGFKIDRSRRVTNIGHGEEDKGQHDQEREIFGVEGAVPMFRRKTLEDIRIEGHFADPDFFWYADDLDFAWRMNMFGWKQIYTPSVIAYHDRSTTKNLTSSMWQFSKLRNFIAMRKMLPLRKRILDYRNTLFTLIKNEYSGNILKDIWPIMKRQLGLWPYFLLFEPRMILEIPTIVKLLPNMVKRRRIIMKKARITPGQIRYWFTHE